MANGLARRYTGRGEYLDDLAQVAALALIKAVDGYDPDRLTPFLSYAVPSIRGAIKRHFRDATWGIKVAQSTQELVLDLPAATATLAQLWGRTPTSVDIAEYMHVTIDTVLAAFRAAEVYRMPSLNAPSAVGSATEVLDAIGAADPHYAVVDDRLTLQSLIAALPPRERRILNLRFFDEMTQDRIATEVGISQVHVSRLLKQSLARLRSALLALDVPVEKGGVGLP